MRSYRLLVVLALTVLAACSASTTAPQEVDELPTAQFSESSSDSANALAGNTMGSGH